MIKSQNYQQLIADSLLLIKKKPETYAASKNNKRRITSQKPSIVKKILIVEDHFLTATGLRILLNEVIEDVEIFESLSFASAIQTSTANILDLIILDIDIPGGTGASMIAQFRTIQPEVKLLICTGFDEKKFALEYIAAGASGFVSKSSERHVMRLAIETVLDNKRYVSDNIQQHLLEELFKKTSEPSVSSEMPRLSEREEEIMKMMLDGKWIKEIAAILKISPNTVSTYKARIFEKLKVNTSLEFFQKASPASKK